ncbi:MAG TPA: ABC transporter ATP-binding protein [Clostridia bacterium]|nr:ABC transporter ATP-binding protein [Clostridia bacterium]
MRKTLSYFFRYWPVALLSLIALAGESVCDLWQPTLLAQMIDEGVIPRDAATVQRYALSMLGITGLGMLCAISRAVLSSHVSQRFGRDVRLALYRKIQSLSLSSVDRFERASLITRLTNDVTQVQNFLNGMMRFFMRAPILCVGGVIMAYLRSPRMASALLVVIPVSALIIVLSIKIGYPFFYKVQNSLDRLNANVREYLSGIRVVKAFNRFAHEKRRFEQSNENLTNASATAMRVTASFGPAISLVVNLGVAAILWIAGAKGENQGNAIAFINYMNQIMFSMGMFSMIFNQLVRALVSGRRMEAVLAAEEGMDLSGTGTLEAVRDGLAFDNVTFTYQDANAPVLEGITLTAKRGETVGIIGPTGSGKSSLVNLVPRFYDVAGGAVKVDGTDIRSLDLHALRERVAIVPQQNLLFTGTIADNLRWGKKDATEAEMWEALAAAQAEGFVRGFPEGLETMLGQGGVNLSGGQKQRVSIARALIKRPDILILDDCTSAVDVTTEAAIRAALKRFSKDILCLMISQRISSVMTADKVAVLDQGRMVGLGTHAELLRSCDVYRDIYRSQIGKEVA